MPSLAWMRERSLVLQVTREDHQVGFLCVDAVDKAFQDDGAVTGTGTHMRVAEVNDAITVESRRQIL